MDLIQIFVLAVGLSMDSLIIALASGAILGDLKRVNILKIAGMLAFMQMNLTIFGWFVGSTFVQYIDKYDHWISFGIFLFLGVRIIIASFKEEECTPFNPLNFKVMLGLAVATSIDATAVGLSLSFMGTKILFPAVVIGIVTFIVCSLGVVFGCKAGEKCSFRLNLAGGIILILIGCSILVEHTILQPNHIAMF